MKAICVMKDQKKIRLGLIGVGNWALFAHVRVLKRLSPLGWEHINLTGDYVWRQNKRVEHGKFRPLRPLARA
jgi:hypothetical protein